jgi:hypothetical protein
MISITKGNPSLEEVAIIYTILENQAQKTVSKEEKMTSWNLSSRLNRNINSYKTNKNSFWKIDATIL